MAETREREREPITVIEIDRPLSNEEAARIKDQFLATVDDRPMLVHGPGMRIYEVEQARWMNRAVLIMAVIGIVLSVTGMVLACIALWGGS